MTENQFRIRWRRWLGQKCRITHDGWTDLLDSNWLSWAQSVFMNHSKEWSYVGIYADIKEIKVCYLKAINLATMDEMYKLDNLYAEDKFEKYNH